jgi:hypothetical protein
VLEWRGSEEDGYVAEVKPGGKQWFGLYVSPIEGSLWSWSVTCMAPLANVANHVDSNSPMPTSKQAKACAESAVHEFMST